MAQVGTFVTATEVPAATDTDFDVATAFVVGFSDWGPIGQAIPMTGLTNMASAIGSPAGTGNPYSARTATCATSFDALETFFSEGGYKAYFTRVAGSAPVAASHVFLDGGGSPSLTITAAYVGAGGNAIYVVMTNNTSTYTITLQDVLGNVLATSPSLASQAAGVTWAATTGLVTATTGAGTLPATVTATALSGGDDKHSSAVLSNWTTALTFLNPVLGPGQVIAPGQTNTNLNGIWSALGTHAQANNRIALLDMDDNAASSALVSAVSSFAATGVASYCGFWAGNVQIPGAVAGTTRSVSPSAAIAGLCARVDQFGQGNVNTAAAGINWPFNWVIQNVSTVTGTGGAIYSLNDLYTLNDAGINTFASIGGTFMNYGFVAAVPSTTDAVYWQLNHGRTRMSIIGDAQIIGQPFVFSQVDGQGGDIGQWQGALTTMLNGYWNLGALYGATAGDAFTVDTGTSVNTASSLQAGNLNAKAAVRLSPFAQKVAINLNAVPITQALPPVASA